MIRLAAKDIGKLADFFRETKVCSIATIRPSLTPHVVPVSFIFSSGRFYTTTRKSAVKYQNLIASPRAALTILSGRDAFVMEGLARTVSNTLNIPSAINRAYIEKYGRERRKSDQSALIEITPSKALITRRLAERFGLV